MLVTPSETSSTYAVYPTYPPLSLLGFKATANPQALYPPPADRTLARPFNVTPEVYQSLLHPAVPLTVALVYGVTVSYINRLNQQRGYLPWSFSRTRAFYFLIVAHNIGLAIYSGWTCFGMLNAIHKSWPGWDGEYGVAGMADALCKINGPGGFGSAAKYDMNTASWSFYDHSLKLFGSEPDPTDVGRLWNEGLAYYGFFFYLSKMYETLDTGIILAKGKQSTLLQTFHHAGAMLCLWAGIRYMSPPIWMFTLINSGIHTLMYTYYALSDLKYEIPPLLKRTLTTLQIVQIVFGTSYALLHLFIAYDVPASSPYLFAKNLSTALPSAMSTVSTAARSYATSADFAAWLKKAALRAAGEEGLAENVRNYQGETFGIDAVHAAQVEEAQREVRYRTMTRKVHCLDTSGQVFAILLNALYLLPLLYLFCQFFYNAYAGHVKEDDPMPSTPENIKKSAQEAVDRVQAKIKKAIEDTQGGITEPPPDVKAQLDDLHTKSRQIAKTVEEAVRDKSVRAHEEMQKDLQKMQERLKTLREKGNEVGEKAINKIKDVASDASKNAKKGNQKAQQGAQNLGNKAKEVAGPAIGTAGETASNIKQNVQDSYKKATGIANDNAKTAKDEAKSAADRAENKADDMSNNAKDDTKAAKNGADDTGKQERDTAKDAVAATSNGNGNLGTKPLQDNKKPANTVSDASKDPSKGSPDDKVLEPHGKDNDKKKERGRMDEKHIDPKIEGSDSQDPQNSTKEDISLKSDSSGPGDKDSTPAGNQEKAKKGKKDKKDGKK